jgi:hypothetical protein
MNEQLYAVPDLTGWFEKHANQFCDSIHGLYRTNSSNFLWLYPHVHTWEAWRRKSGKAIDIGRYNCFENVVTAASADNRKRLAKYLAVHATGKGE